MNRHRTRIAGLLPAMAVALFPYLAACDDEILAPCGAYTPDWEGVTCFMEVQCISCHSTTHLEPPVVHIFPDDVKEDLLHCQGSLVVPYSPEDSQLWRVISGELDHDVDVWGVMPYVDVPGGGRPLPDSEIEHIREWILNGADVNPLNPVDCE